MMKYLVVVSLIAAVASAGYLKPAPVTSELQEVQEIIAAIQSPSTDPATAAALEQLLLETLGIAPIQPAPVVVDESPISVGPAIIDFPLPDGGAVTAPETPALVPAPVIDATPAAVADAAAPLVQIILNINQASAEAPAAISPAPVDTPVIPVDSVLVVDEVVKPETPVQVVDVAPEPVQVVDIVPTPVQVVDAAPEPVQVVDLLPAPVQVVEVEPIQIGAPVIPTPVVTLPDELN